MKILTSVSVFLVALFLVLAYPTAKAVTVWAEGDGQGEEAPRVLAITPRPTSISIPTTTPMPAVSPIVTAVPRTPTTTPSPSPTVQPTKFYFQVPNRPVLAGERFEVLVGRDTVIGGWSEFMITFPPDVRSLTFPISCSSQGLCWYHGYFSGKAPVDERITLGNLFSMEPGVKEFRADFYEKATFRFETITKTVEIIAGPSPIPSPTVTPTPPPPCRGDLNGDGKIDIIDVQIIAGRWNTKSGHPLYEKRYDLDEDGDIDIFDVQAVTSRWGTACLNRP
jgi:hypothetical protein